MSGLAEVKENAVGRCSEGWAMVYEPEGIMGYCLLTSGEVSGTGAVVWEPDHARSWV